VINYYIDYGKPRLVNNRMHFCGKDRFFIMEKKTILLVDDDSVTLKLIEGILTEAGYETIPCISSIDALQIVKDGQHTYDCILSDYFMPDLNGGEFLEEVRKHNPDVTFIFLTANTNLNRAIELIKEGADDYITKPIIKDVLLFRLNKSIQEKENIQYIENIEKERELVQLENEKLVNWRNLYASKDARQTEQLIKLLSRTINQTGGFAWLDLLDADMQQLEDGRVSLDPSIVELIKQSAGSYKQIFDYISFISELDTMELEFKEYPFADFVKKLQTGIANEAIPVLKNHGMDFDIYITKNTIKGNLSVDITYIVKIIKELAVNAIKYSKPKSNVHFILEENVGSPVPSINICVRSKPRQKKARDRDGNVIVGIPYDYSELVFDLFYTIESFPNYLEEEEWSDGTGLYVARKLIYRHDGWIKCSNGLDYTKEKPEPYLKFDVSLPYHS